jgi:glycine/D-amino acid oxidase-like deaminating enzyme
MERRASALIRQGGWDRKNELNADEFVICPDANGNLLTAQRSFVSPRMEPKVPVSFLQDMCRNVMNWYPSLSGSRIIRSWICPVPFVEDARPLFGYVNPFENIAVSSGYGSVLIMAPALGKMGADLLLHRKIAYNIEAFDPNRYDGQEFVK